MWEDHEDVSVGWEPNAFKGGRETEREAKPRVREGKGRIKENGNVMRPGRGGVGGGKPRGTLGRGGVLREGERGKEVKGGGGGKKRSSVSIFNLRNKKRLHKAVAAKVTYCQRGWAPGTS